jgi:hypothetical protein
MPWVQYFHDRLSAIEKHLFGEQAATEIAEQSPDFHGGSEPEVTTAPTPVETPAAPVGPVIGASETGQ